MYSVTLRFTKANRSSIQNVLRLSGEPVMKLSMPRTSQPRASSDSHRWDPMKPAAPVTTTRIRRSGPSPAAGSGLNRDDGLAPDRVVFEAEPAHPFRLPDVAAVEHRRPPHHGPQPLEVEELELVPLRDQRHRVDA